MKIVVDTNIIFSALLNTNNSIGDIIFNSGDVFQFYSCTYMRVEIEKHRTKLKRISGLSDKDLDIAFEGILSKIIFINEGIIPESTWIKAEKIVRDIDEDDIDFVALARHLRAYLWTGDKALYLGLKGHNFKRVYVTSELLTIRDDRR